MDFLSNIVQQVITVLYNMTATVGLPNYGLAIIIMTIIVKILLYPLTKKQIESTKAMMAMQPKMKAIQEKYKNDKQRLNMELANLYKQENVNPLAGCLPLLVQMPIMIGIFYGIRDFHYVGPANFLWIQSISNPDPMYILPVLSALTTFVQSKQTMPDTSSAQNKMMLYFMPLFIGYISFSFPAGLVLYWVVMNLMQIGQQALMNKATVKTTRDKVNIEVIEEAKNGLFGLFSKKAKIRVTLKDAAAKIGDVVEEALDNIKADVQAGKEEYKNTAVDTDTEAAVKKEFVVDEEAVQAGKEFLQKIFHSMKIEVVMEKFVNKADSTVTLKLHGPDMGILIGKHGQTLDALQYLTNLVANKNSSERIRIIIDVEDYRERRIETLSRLAVRLADKVKRNGERVVLEPMNPHERKIIHMALQNDRRITTLSEGEEPYRKVVIELKK